MAGLHRALTALLAVYDHQGDCPVSAGCAPSACACWQSELGVDLRRLLSEHRDEAAGEQFVITSLSIDGVQPTYAEPHPERTPIGPFPSREAAWDYAQAMQLRHGRGGGSVDVAPLIAPATPS